MTHIKYMVVDEFSTPSYFVHNTDELLYDSCDANVQTLWLVGYDEEEKEIIEWVERYRIYDDDKALARAEYLNRKLRGEERVA